MNLEHHCGLINLTHEYRQPLLFYAVFLSRIYYKLKIITIIDNDKERKISELSWKYKS
jgi:hypothetical protein